MSTAPAATEPRHSNFSPHEKPSWDLYSRCVHCGLCLDQCPTYRALGTEMDSPRGRIYQIVQVDEGRLALSDSFVTHIDRCLGCLNCQTACPSGVAYGSLLERARSQIAENYQRPWLATRLRKHFYEEILPSFGKLARHARFVRFYQRSGLQALARATGLLRGLGVAELDALSPRIDSEFSFSDLGRVFPAEAERRGRVALLIGCVASVAFAELNRATIRVLTKNGIEVHVPDKQSCCGALQLHAGLLDLARQQARRNIAAMESAEFDAIVTNAAGCGSTLKEYAALLQEDPIYAERARQFTAKARDINEYLAEVGMREPKRKINKRVTYQDSCHLAHAQGVRSAPRQLLRHIGAEVVESPRSDSCCGSAGVYNVVQNEISMKVLDEKMGYVASVEPEVIATANVGCMLQFRAGVARRKMTASVAHVVELLDDAY
ncbi:MAG TPA: heterodisulfide reductase-related iron-sulfur binding cluster [Candidatus Eisenbacteria bacterium]|nr:heterodisulfide reductase-related iron-sulfur binding cluster [Candidatus Eisenbacteria bacterium]